jgi:uncharacterized protein YaaR (DUF327 family)
MEKSFVDIVREMVRAGESMDKIKAALIEQGVSEDEAERLISIVDTKLRNELQEKMNSLLDQAIETQRLAVEYMLMEEAIKYKPALKRHLPNIIELFEKVYDSSFPHDRVFAARLLCTLMALYGQEESLKAELIQEIEAHEVDPKIGKYKRELLDKLRNMHNI